MPTDREQLVSIMDAGDLRQIDVAQEADVSPAYIGMQVSGVRRVTDEVLHSARRTMLRRLAGRLAAVAGVLEKMND